MSEVVVMTAGGAEELVPDEVGGVLDGLDGLDGAVAADVPVELGGVVSVGFAALLEGARLLEGAELVGSAGFVPVVAAGGCGVASR